MDYARMVATAERLIKANGATVTMAAPIDGQDTPFAGVAAPLAPVSVTMLSINAGLARYYKFKVSKDEDRQDGSLLAIMSGKQPAPVYRSTVVWADGLAYYVRAFDVLAPNGTPILYFLELSR